MPEEPPDPQHAPSAMYLVRHGATKNNLMNPPALQGNTVDHGLSAEGKVQAQQSGEYFRQRTIAGVYASPLIRAVETANAIAEPHALNVVQIPEIVEVDVGRWEGRQWNWIETEDAENYRRFMDDPDTHGYPGGETMRQVRDRVTPVFERLLREHAGSTFVVVAHNVVIRSYLGSLLGLTGAGSRQVPQKNCGINLVRFRRGKPRVTTINYVGHLHEDR